MLVQAFVTGTALFFAYKTVLTVVNDHEKNWLYVLCVLLGSYLLFYPDTYKNALFWASASVLYVWPLCPLMIGIYLVYTWHFQHAQSCGRLFLMGMMFFLAGFSQEQIIVAAISFAPLFLVSASSISQFRILKKPLLTVQCAALLGSCCMLAAPGNFKRLASGHDGGMHTLAELPAVTWELVRDMLRAPGGSDLATFPSGGSVSAAGDGHSAPAALLGNGSRYACYFLRYPPALYLAQNLFPSQLFTGHIL